MTFVNFITIANNRGDLFFSFDESLSIWNIEYSHYYYKWRNNPVKRGWNLDVKYKTLNQLPLACSFVFICFLGNNGVLLNRFSQSYNGTVLDDDTVFQHNAWWVLFF